MPDGARQLKLRLPAQSRPAQTGIQPTQSLPWVCKGSVSQTQAQFMNVKKISR